MASAKLKYKHRFGSSDVKVNPSGLEIGIIVPNIAKEKVIVKWAFDDIFVELKNSNFVILSKRNEQEWLEFDRQNFLEIQNLLPKHFQVLKKPLYIRGLFWVLIFSLLVIGIALLTYYKVLPYIVEKSADFVPKKWEQEIGKVVFKNLASSKKIDTARTELLDQYFHNIYNNLETKEIRVWLFNDTIVNAFAIPGGTIVVNSGLLNRIQQSDELAAVLSHELVHLEKKHSLKSLFSSMSSGIFFYIIFGDLNSLLALMAKQGVDLNQLSYSRSMETEADTIGVRHMIEHHLNPQGMVQLLDIFENQSDQRAPSIFSTHPEPAKRKQLILDSFQPYFSNIYPTNPALNGLFKQIKN